MNEQQIRDLTNEIIIRTDIVKVVSKFVQLKRKANEWLGLCPFHAEKSPSFSVNTKKGLAKCFGCGWSGDVVAFVKEHEKKPFLETLQFLAEEAHLNINLEPARNTGSLAGKPEKQIKGIDKALMVQSMQYYQHNTFTAFLAAIHGENKVLQAAFNYNVGTAKDKGTIFWQVDQFMRIRTAQKIVYDDTCHRIKSIPPVRLFTVSKGYTPCLFGEHLLFENDKDVLVCIVESEKSAVICSLYLPSINNRKVVWMAACGSNGLTEEKIQPLAGYEVCLCPDFSWLSRAVWGLEPMRRAEVDGRMKMHPDGEIDTEYVSAAHRLHAIGCKVSFYDPFPNINNGTDIADELLKLELVKKVDETPANWNEGF
jgi:hypothetical protein